mmetsp:Transcript_36851/g.88682  ORF Transcript_36851/g.88682 Transcript_36851/m.88682 type:complete len:205 (-) Transcript_36851:649-1263(-)
MTTRLMKTLPSLACPTDFKNSKLVGIQRPAQVQRQNRQHRSKNAAVLATELHPRRHAADYFQKLMTLRIASTKRCSFGTKNSSHANGNGASNPQTRCTGASREVKHCSWISAAISPPNPPVFVASWAMTNRPVLVTESITVCRSQGKIVCRSITSQLTPSSASARFAAAISLAIWLPQPSSVTSLPWRMTSACPKGREKSPDGT